MTEQQKLIIKEKIHAELERIAQDIKNLEAITTLSAADDMDEITRMDAIVNKSINDAALSASRNKFAALEYALKRIDTTDFGVCIECGDEISLPRIMAMPETTLCINCAS